MTRVAVAVGDAPDVVRKGMFGTAPRFAIYEVDEAGRGTLLELRNNPYADTQQHGKTLDVWAMLQDCSALVASHVGPRGQERLRQRGVRLVLTGRCVPVDEALRRVPPKLANGR